MCCSRLELIIIAYVQETKIRVYCKRNDDAIIDALHQATLEWAKNQFNEEDFASATPRPRRQQSPDMLVREPKKARKALFPNA